MKILSVTAQRPDSTGSGIYLTELIKGFKKMGCEQAVICGSTKEDVVSMPEGVQVHSVFYETDLLPYPIAGMSDEMPYESTRYRDMTEDMTKQFDQAFLSKVRQVVDAFQPDLILCHHLYYLASLIREVYPEKRIYGICHGSDLRQVKKNPWKRAYIQKWIPKLDKICVLHEEQKQAICSFYECEEDHVEVIGTGYNHEMFYRTEGNREGILFAGKISEKKGVKSLIRAMEYLQEEKMTLSLAGGYGNQEEYEEITALAEASSCKVQFLGKLTQDELREAMNRHEIFALPSFYEGLPLTVIEAMACGDRVVCTDLPGIKPWLDGSLPVHNCVFIEPPKMKNEDEPIEEELPSFEKRIAEAIQKARMLEQVPTKELEKLSWLGLCKHLLSWSEK